MGVRKVTTANQVKAEELMTPDADWFKNIYGPLQPTTVPARGSGRVLTVHRNRHEAALGVRTMPGRGHELLLSVDGEWRRTRMFRCRQPLEMLDAIATIEAGLTARGWEGVPVRKRLHVERVEEPTDYLRGREHLS
jgi:hypothetical protein